MSIARVLPAALAPRFKGAQRAVLSAGDASFETVVADRFMLRLRGLAGLDEAAIVPLLFPRCRSLHTFGMRAPIDVAWLDVAPDGEGHVLAVAPAVPPRRTTRAARARDARDAARFRTAALELPAGSAEALGLEPDTAIRVSTSRAAPNPD